MKVVLKIFGFLIALILLFCILTIIYLNNYWRSKISEDEFIRITNIINESEQLTRTFYAVHDELFPGLRKRGIFKGAIKELRLEMKEYSFEDLPVRISKYKDSSPTIWVFEVLKEQSLINNMGDSNSLGMWFPVAIQHYTETEKCFDFFYQKKRFSYQINDTLRIQATGINGVAKLLYDKELNNLNESEIKELIHLVEWDDQFILEKDLY